MDPEQGILTVKEDESTLWAVIHRPETLNAVNFELMEKLEGVLGRVEKNERIRSFILTAKGHSAFISGGDLKEFHQFESADEGEQMARRMLDILERIERLPCWSIASINGATYGGGCEIMLAFDFRIASNESSFGFTQGNFFLPPGWGGLTRLIERVGRSTALRWLGEAAIVDAQTALSHRLIDRSVPGGSLPGITEVWAKTLSRNDREYIGTLKEGALKSAQYRWEAIDAEIKGFARLWEDSRHHDRVRHFLDRNA